MEEKKQQELIAQMNEKLKFSMPLLRDKFFMTLIQDEIEDISGIQDRIRFLEIHMETDGLFCIFVIGMDDRLLVMKDMTEKARQMTSLMLIHLCETIISAHGGGYVFENKQGEYVCLLNFNDTKETDGKSLFLIAQEMKDKILMEYDLSVTIGIGTVVRNILHLHKSYLAAGRAAQQKLYIGKNQIIFSQNTESDPDMDIPLDYKTFNKAPILLKTADKENLSVYLDDMFGHMRQSHTAIHWCRSFALQLYLTSLKIFIGNRPMFI